MNYSLTTFIALVVAYAAAQEGPWPDVAREMVGMVEKLHDKVEEAISTSWCGPEVAESCERSSFHSCWSTFGEGVCVDGLFHDGVNCGGDCGTLWLQDRSSVMFPPGADNNTKVFQEVCATLQLDDYFKAETERVTPFFQNLSLEAPHLAFVGVSGLLRIFPGRSYTSDWCDTYDPRRRPSFAAGTAGPRNIVMVLDTSDSTSVMVDGRTILGHSIEAAEAVLDSLTFQDKVAIVTFDSGARPLGDFGLVPANRTIKEQFREMLTGVSASGGTNYKVAFEVAFDLFQQAIKDGTVTSCNSAILFVTDGMMTEPVDAETEVRDLVVSGFQELESLLGHPVLFFSYGISDDPMMHAYQKEMACAVSTGVYRKVDTALNIVEALASYLSLYADAISSERFVAFTEEYSFASTGGSGFSVVSPVFNRSSNPHQLIGVVVVETRSEDLSSLGIPLREDYLSFAQNFSQCPSLNVTSCLLERLRSLGDDGSCGSSEDCPLDSGGLPCLQGYPELALNNTQKKGVPYEEHACCRSRDGICRPPVLGLSATNPSPTNLTRTPPFTVGTYTATTSPIIDAKPTNTDGSPTATTTPTTTTEATGKPNGMGP